MAQKILCLEDLDATHQYLCCQGVASETCDEADMLSVVYRFLFREFMMPSL